MIAPLFLIATACAVLILAGVTAKKYATARLQFWKREGRMLLTPGYVPPPPTVWGRAFLRIACRLGTFLTVGPLKVTGRENARYAGSLAVTPNHSHEPDFLVVGAALRSSFRQLASANNCRGKSGILAAWAGTFAVPVKDGKADGSGLEGKQINIGSVTAHAGAEILHLRSEKLLWFPQGQLYPDNSLLPEQFQTGIVRAVKLAGGDTAILPIGIHYLKSRRPMRLTWARKKFGFTSFGANVAIGEPILCSSLPDDFREATEVIRLAIADLVSQAKSM